MTKETQYGIILRYSDYLQRLNSLLHISRDVIAIKSAKREYYDENLIKLVAQDFSNFDEIYKEHEKDFRAHYVYEHDFDYLFFNSIFINFFSLFEIYLSTLGQSCENISELRVKMKDIKGNGTVDTYRKYFSLILKIESAANDNPLWKELMEFKEIRNAIVHNENKLNINLTPNINSLKGLNKLKQHNIRYFGKEVSFKIDNIEFLVDFKDKCEEYTGMLTKEILKNYC